MIRFLILCTVFFLLYLAFNVVGEFDTNMQFIAYGYEIELTLFTFGALFILAQLVFMIILKVIFLVFNMPSIVKKKWHQRRLLKVNKQLLTALAQMLMGNRKKSLVAANGIINEVDDDNKEVISLVLAEAEESFDKKIQHFRNLIDKKNYSVYASKKLAQIFYENMHPKQAEECAIRAFNEDDTDTDLMLILIRIYASLNEWPKLAFVFAKLQRTNKRKIEENSEEIAKYYYAAAKYYLQKGSDESALKYLESALEVNPIYIEALNLFSELSTNVNNTVAILKILRTAFSANPCFEIARMYADSATGSVEAIYGTLASIAQPAKYPALFLALAAYLGLIEKISDLKEKKLIAYESSV